MCIPLRSGIRLPDAQPAARDASLFEDAPDHPGVGEHVVVLVFPDAGRAGVTTRRCNRLPKPGRRRALELLAGCGMENCSEHVLRAHGFTTEQMVQLVRSGLATATPQRVRAGHDTIEIGTLWITEAGRRALAKVRA
jgi:hypothetical protein